MRFIHCDFIVGLGVFGPISSWDRVYWNVMNTLPIKIEEKSNSNFPPSLLLSKVKSKVLNGPNNTVNVVKYVRSP